MKTLLEPGKTTGILRSEILLYLHINTAFINFVQIQIFKLGRPKIIVQIAYKKTGKKTIQQNLLQRWSIKNSRSG